MNFESDFLITQLFLAFDEWLSLRMIRATTDKMNPSIITNQSLNV